jgi:hypothetical protein
MKLDRTDWKYIVATLMFLCTLGIVAIGLLMGFVIPEGPLGAGQSKYFLGLHRHQWGDIHLYLSLAFTALVVVHIVLAWRWIKSKAKGLFGKAWKTGVALTVLAAVILPLLFWLTASKNDPAYAEFGTGRGRQAAPAAEAAGQPGETAGDVDVHEDRTVAGRMEADSAEVVITGKMTLREVERTVGISAEDILARLGLPAGVSLDETIGRLRRTYGFEMQALRNAVAELLKAKRQLPML